MKVFHHLLYQLMMAIKSAFNELLIAESGALDKNGEREERDSLAGVKEEEREEKKRTDADSLSRCCSSLEKKSPPVSDLQFKILQLHGEWHFMNLITYESSCIHVYSEYIKRLYSYLNSDISWIWSHMRAHAFMCTVNISNDYIHILIVTFHESGHIWELMH